MLILGISAYYHDSACALTNDGDIVAAAQEERFTRIKHDPRFPHYALDYCLSEAGITFADLDHIVFYDKPFLKFERLLETYLAFAPKGFKSFSTSMLVWLKDKLFLKDTLLRELALHGERGDLARVLLFSEHHLSHAASAFYPSPFNEAAILTMDGVGEWATTSVAAGRGKEIEILREIHFPHSLGLLYSAFTYYTGFKVNSGEYKLMGLAPYGTPRYAGTIREHLVDVKSDGSFRLNMDYFDYCTGFTMTNSRFNDLFGGPARRADEPLTPRHMDIAASIQTVTEDIIVRMARNIAATTGQKNLCLAGGVALNCVANGRILRDGAFEKIWIQPASGDAGGALGAALAAYHLNFGNERTHSDGRSDRMKGAYLGPAFSQDDIEERLHALGAVFDVEADEVVLRKCVDDLVAGKAVGLFQGRMEYGPRALGSRSILADPRSAAMQSQLNHKVKFRESFRPFAPSVLCEDAGTWFELSADSPYMLLCADVVKDKRRIMTDEEQKLFGIDKLNSVRSEIPAVTHVDYSARIQTVHKETNPRYHELITRFKERTGCPVVVNTSFNVRGEPIVCTPEDAFRCFMGTDIESLAIGNCYLEKSQQNPQFMKDYINAFVLD
ncbi:MAG TPA: carbamoyltransferase [Desulfuromonadales bacterium]|nr:carbamoyltransferase [Desulfuromonadales bacterium]